MSRRFKFNEIPLPKELRSKVMQFSALPTANVISKSLEDNYNNEVPAFLSKISYLPLIQELRNKINSTNLDDIFTQEELDELLEIFLSGLENNMGDYVRNKKIGDFSRRLQEKLTQIIQRNITRSEHYYETAYKNWIDHFENPDDYPNAVNNPPLTENIMNKWDPENRGLPEFTDEEIDIQFENFMNMIGNENVYEVIDSVISNQQELKPAGIEDYIADNKIEDFAEKVRADTRGRPPPGFEGGRRRNRRNTKRNKKGKKSKKNKKTNKSSRKNRRTRRK